LEIEEELKKLFEEGVVEKLKEHRQKVRYKLKQKQVSEAKP
jgi:predicted transcriptional regulator